MDLARRIDFTRKGINTLFAVVLNFINGRVADQALQASQRLLWVAGEGPSSLGKN